MARIAGITLPPDKRIEVGLTYIYGIGRSKSRKILDEAKIDRNKKVKALAEDEVNKIRQIIEKREKIEGDLRKEVTMNIKRLVDIGCYRGLRHKKKLPVRGQRTKTNARTRQGATVVWASAGTSGFKGARKGTPFAAQLAAKDAATKAREFGLRYVDVRLKGPGAGREASIRAMQAAGLEIKSIKDVTPIPHNGCRARRRRRGCGPEGGHSGGIRR